LLPGFVAASLMAIPLAGSPPARAQDQKPDDVAALRAEIEALRKDYEARLTALEEKLSALAAAPTPAPQAAPQVAIAPPLVPSGPGAQSQTSNYFNPAMSVIGNFLSVGGSQGPDHLDSANLRESELGVQAIVDPYARADFFLSFGEEGVG